MDGAVSNRPMRCSRRDSLGILPGSRNAPLAIAAEHHPAIETVVIHDERSAAFFALGLAEQLGQPVALCCTSGSAPANYLPAITEAYYRSIPLLVVSADRPMAWTDQGDGQTIRQHGIFKDFTHRVLHLEDRKEESSTLWEYQRDSAFLLNQLALGPVHINLGLSEPLYGTETKDRFYHRTISLIENQSIDTMLVETLVELMKNRKVMVLCGQHPPLPGFRKRWKLLVPTNRSLCLPRTLRTSFRSGSMPALIDRLIPLTHLSKLTSCPIF